MFRRIAPFGIAALLATSAAASDIEIIDAPEIDVSKSVASEGWYIRGDLGYSGWIKGGRPRVVEAGGARAFDERRFSRPLSYGVGLGYQFSDLLRADLTADFSKGDFRGGAACAGGDCAFKADYSAAGLMANGYVDLGTLAGFTPYLGAGLGATWLDWRNAACAGAGCTSPSLEGRDGLRFTYALMAGASVDLSSRVKLDVGYRFSGIAGGDAFRTGTGDMEIRDRGFHKHEFRVGLRVPLW
ncbi:porin family protein [Shinella sp. PSBB067]|uniref:outer membrane protein n=1 Tax=Shinella sp. PSBB067 TaxID=2715959 RepID=UPI00193B6636|nr:outer membrane protein [Shinella sp. PSBB067]QRI61965.1 porin family protein [Shinella sp. PSBB067]